MDSNEIRSRFLKFFEKRGHKIIPSASLVPENDPSVLFNTAGMQPLVPYLLGQQHPMGKRIVNIQKCVRTGDLDDIGDNRHFSFFEMMGNWSLGDYFKEDAIKWSYEFLTNGDDKPEGSKGLDLKIDRLYFTVYERETKASKIWEALGIKENRIYKLGKKDNWWSAGDEGPCGPDTEMFYDVTEVGLKDLSHSEFLNAVEKEDIVEIWNDVFMEFNQKVKEEKREEYNSLKMQGKFIPEDFFVLEQLDKKNVDTGAGLERITAVMQGKRTAYETDLFQALVSKISDLIKVRNEKLERIIADHLRASVLMISDGVTPSNSERGYILRRLIRRTIRCGHSLTMNNDYKSLVDIIEKKYGNIYPRITENKNKIVSELEKEYIKFIKTLALGLKKIKELFKKEGNINTFGLNDNILFDLYQTDGFPIELSLEEINLERSNQGLLIMDEQLKKRYIENFNKKMTEHQKLSQTSSAGMFKGGLANHNEKTIKLHTAHHLLLAGLQAVVDKNIKQRGSNITEERLRIDFLCDHKLTDEEKKKVEDWVNDKIKLGLDVVRKEMPLKEAEKLGAEMEFGAKYPDVVSVYFIEDKNGSPISKEFCGGPHVESTKELGKFKIQKEEAVAQGIRRIKAILL